MCVGGPSISAPAPAASAAATTPPPPPPSAVDPAVLRAKQDNRAKAALAQGRASTILTSAQGDLADPTTIKKTLLGV